MLYCLIYVAVTLSAVTTGKLKFALGIKSLRSRLDSKKDTLSLKLSRASCSNTGSIRDDPYWTSRKNSLKLMELSSINKVSLVQVSFCSDTGSIRDDPYWTSRKNSLELIEISSINKVSLV